MIKYTHPTLYVLIPYTVEQYDRKEYEQYEFLQLDMWSATQGYEDFGRVKIKNLLFRYAPQHHDKVIEIVNSFKNQIMP